MTKNQFDQFDEACRIILEDENKIIPMLKVDDMVSTMEASMLNYENEIRDPELELTEEQINQLIEENNKHKAETHNELQKLKTCNCKEGCIMIEKLLRESFNILENIIGAVKLQKMLYGRTVDSIIHNTNIIMRTHVAWNK